jgi:hypothetical protein
VCHALIYLWGMGSLEERDSTIATLQTSLKMANKELEKWNSAFTDHPLLPAGTSPGNRLPYNILPIVCRKTTSVELNIHDFLWCASIPSAFIAGDLKDHL